MKTLLLTILSAIIGQILFIGCTADAPSDAWRIEGTVKSDNAADTFYIVSEADRDTIATLYARDGQIVPLQDTVGHNTLCRIAASGHRRVQTMLICLEYGTIRLDIDLTGERKAIDNMGGTPLNEVLRRFFLARQFDYEHGTLDDWRQRCRRITAEVCNIVSQYPDHPISEFVIWVDFNVMPPQVVDSLLNSLSAPVRMRNYVSIVEEQNSFRYGSQEGDLLKDARGIDLHTGDSVRMSDYIGHGQYVLLDFWGSFCRPCIATMPRLQEVYERCKGNGLLMVGVMPRMSNNVERAREIVQQLGVTYPQVADIKTMSTYGVCSLPTLMLIGPDGRICTPCGADPGIILADVERRFGNGDGL